MKLWVLEAKSKKTFNLLSRFIMWKQGTNYSHMACAVEYENNQVTVYHAKWPKPVKCSYEEFKKEYQVQNSYRLSDPQKCDYIQLVGLMETFTESKTYYSMLQLVLIFLQIEFSKLKTIFNMAILNHERGLICSELIARVLNHGWGLSFKSSYDSIDLVEASEKAQSVKYIGE